MRLKREALPGVTFAPWIVAGIIFLGAGAPAVAQESTPAPIEVSAESTDPPADLPAATTDAVGSAAAPSTVPSAGVGIAAGGTGPLSLGALVGAGIAAVFALRERFKNR